MSAIGQRRRQTWAVFADLNHLLESRRELGRPYLEFLREASMSVGLYVLAAGSRDEQSPHSEDEMYIVLSGRGQMTVANETRNVAVGSLVFVERHVEHRFHDIEEELRVIILFPPPEGSTARRAEMRP